MNGLVISLTLCLLQPATEAVDGIEPRQCYELRTFDSREECRITAAAIRVKAKGARITCVPRLLSPDEKRLIAIQEGRWP